MPRRRLLMCMHVLMQVAMLHVLLIFPRFRQRSVYLQANYLAYSYSINVVGHTGLRMTFVANQGKHSNISTFFAILDRRKTRSSVELQFVPRTQQKGNMKTLFDHRYKDNL